MVQLEEEWGDELLSNKQADAAISHFIEAGRTIKALDAAITARQWKKAMHIIEVRTCIFKDFVRSFSIILIPRLTFYPLPTGDR